MQHPFVQKPVYIYILKRPMFLRQSISPSHRSVIRYGKIGSKNVNEKETNSTELYQ